MFHLSRTPLLSLFLLILSPAAYSATPAPWSSSDATHAIGLPNVKANEKGTLAISGTALTFTGKLNRSTLPLDSLLEASAGNERVELWGIKGRLLRMAIPNGGGLLAATVMHHRVDMLSVAFLDANHGYHQAVFYMPAKEAEHALQVLSASVPSTHPPLPATSCEAAPASGPSVRILLPEWNNSEVPPGYRALVYEHLVAAFEHTPNAGHVFRDGESDPNGACPQYTVQISVHAFRHGNQVERASMGPAGFFVGTTQITFDVKALDHQQQLVFEDESKATIRGESESTGVAQKMAHKIVKTYTQRIPAPPQLASNRPASR